MARIPILVALGLLGTVGCTGPTEPDQTSLDCVAVALSNGEAAELRSLEHAKSGRSGEAGEVTIWTVRHNATLLEIPFSPVIHPAGSDLDVRDGTFLTLHGPENTVWSRPDGTRLAKGGSVTISLDLDRWWTVERSEYSTAHSTLDVCIQTDAAVSW
jgi:hypothetical protein